MCPFPEMVIEALHSGFIAIMTTIMFYPFLFPTVIMVMTHYMFQRVSLLVVFEHVTQCSVDIKY